MVDIHCHYLYGVDDGPDVIEDTILMMEEASKQGITDIIMTPHYRRGMFYYHTEDVEKNFAAVRQLSSQYGVTVYLGCEYHVNSDIVANLDRHRVHTLGDSPYVLTEYKTDSEPSYIRAMSREVVSAGYIPIIAHVERYEKLYRDINIFAELRDLGAMIQVNADALLGHDGFSAKKFTRNLVKRRLVDFVASDAHDMKKRGIHMAEAYKLVSKKFGEEMAKRIFVHNGHEIIRSAVTLGESYDEQY